MSIITYALESVGQIVPPKLVSLTASDGTVLEFDAAMRETHAGQSRPTDHPVEAGAVVSDHVIDDPDTLELNAVVSNRPILFLGNQRPSVRGGDPNTRAEDAYKTIVRFRKSALLVTVYTRLFEYTNMLVVSESVTRDKDSSEILDISIRLREFRTATIEDVDAPEPIEPTEAPKRDLGQQQTRETTKTVDNKARGLNDDFNSIGSFFGFSGAQ